MTRKNTTLTMFGIAMFAVMGMMMVTPAFAGMYQLKPTLIVDGSGLFMTTDSAETVCTNSRTITSNLAVSNNEFRNHDRISVTWDADYCAGFEKVKIEVIVDGTEIAEKTYKSSNDYWSFTVSPSVIDDDCQVKAHITFYTK